MSSSKNNYTELIKSIEKKDMESIEKLILDGVDVNAEDFSTPNKYTPLMIAARCGNKEAAVALIQAGAKINTKNPSGYTPLMEATWFGRHDMVNQLILAKARLNIKNNEGNTALSEAALLGHEDIVKTLVKAGADVKTINKKGLTPYDLTHNNNIKIILGKYMTPVFRLKRSFIKLIKTIVKR